MFLFYDIYVIWKNKNKAKLKFSWQYLINKKFNNENYYIDYF